MIRRDVDIIKLEAWAKRAAIDLNAYLQAARDAGHNGLASTRILIADYHLLIGEQVVDPVPELDGE